MAWYAAYQSLFDDGSSISHSFLLSISAYLLTCAFSQPHLPWVVPQKYYDRFPPDEVKLPPYATTNNWKEWEERVWEDLKDVPEYAINKIANPDKEFTEVIELGKWETSIQSYLAAIVSSVVVFTIVVSG